MGDIEVKRIKQSEVTLGDYHIGMCVDAFADGEVWAVANYDEKLPIRFSPDLKRLGTPAGFENIIKSRRYLTNLLGIASIKLGLLISISGLDRVVLFSRDGSVISDKYFNKVGAYTSKEIIPASDTSAFVVGAYAGLDTGKQNVQSLFKVAHKEHGCSVFDGSPEKIVTCAALGEKKSLYAVVYSPSANEKNFVHAARDATEKHPSFKELFSIETAAKVDAVAWHPSGSLVFASNDGCLHFYYTGGKKAAEPFDTGMKGCYSHALAVSPSGRLYVAANRHPIIEVWIKNR